MSIQLLEALNEMNKTVNGRPVSFFVSFYTCDRKKNTGGELISLSGVVLSRKKTVLTSGRNSESSSSSKRPNHYENATRNFVLPNGEIRKAHIRLIESFNGMEVYW